MDLGFCMREKLNLPRGERYELCRSVHSEANAIISASRQEMLGGTITNARVFAPGLFHAWGKQVVGGLGWELVKNCVEENGDSLPDFSNWDIKRHWTGQIGLNVFLYAMLCDEALKQAGCDVLFHTVCAKLEEKKDEMKEAEARLLQREANIDKRDELFQKREASLDEREEKLESRQLEIQNEKSKVDEIKKEQLDLLQKISGFGVLPSLYSLIK